MQSESTQLKAEVETAREQSVLAESVAENEIMRHMEEVHAVEEDARKLEAQLNERKAYLLELQSEQQGLQQEVDSVRSKLSEASIEGDELIAENERLLRSRTSTVRVLRSEVGMAEARVDALYGIVGEKREELGKMHLSEMLHSDDM